MRNIERVREFHETYKCFINPEPSVSNVDNELVFIRYKITREEVEELAHAILTDDRVEMIDALVDIQYLVDGTYLTFGVDYGVDISSQETMPNNFAFVSALNICLDGLLSAYKDDKDVNEIRSTLDVARYVVGAAREALGFSPELFEEASAEVHRSNMSKLGNDGKPIYREDGKVMKGPNYFKPDLKAILEKYEG